MTDIQLTPAELEMIRIKREQEELEAKKKEVERKLAIEKKYADASELIRKADEGGKKKAELLTIAHRTLSTMMGSSEYTLVLNEGEREITIYDPYEYRTEIDRIKYNTYNPYIKHKSGLFSISIGSITHHSRIGSSQTFQYSISGPTFQYGRVYKNINTINKKIQDYMKLQKEKTIAEQKKLNQFEYLMVQLKGKFPQAEIKKSSYGYYTSSYKGQWKSVETVEIVYPNGVKVHVTPYRGDEYAIQKIEVPTYNKDHDIILQGLSQIKVENNPVK